MIGHSDALLEYYKKTDRSIGQFVRIEISVSESKSYTIEDSGVVAGSLSISRRAVNASSFNVCAAVINEAKFTAINDVVEFDSELEGARVKIFTGVNMTGWTESFQVFDGIIGQNCVTRRVSTTEIKCNSVISLFDKSVGNEALTNDCYTFVIHACTQCGVEFALSEEEFKSMSTNSGYSLYYTPGEEISVYGEILVYVSQIMGGFFTDTPDGKLTFKSYDTSADVFEINRYTIFSSKYGDGIVNMDGMTWYENDEKYYISGDYTSKYVVELVKNPLMDKLTTELFGIIGNGIYNKLKDLDLRYVEIEYNGCPLVELGDRLYIQHKNITVFITSLTWTYRGKSTISSVAIDKRVNSEQQSIKSASKSGGGGSSENTISVIRFINGKKISVGESWVVGVSTYFSTPAGVTPYIDMCVVLDIPADGLLSVKVLYENKDTVPIYKWNLKPGAFTIDISKSFSASEESRAHGIRILFSYEITDTEYTGQRKKIDIEQYGLEMNIIAYKAVAAVPTWTGFYELSDTVPVFNVTGPVLFKSLSDSGPSISFENA